MDNNKCKSKKNNKTYDMKAYMSKYSSQYYKKNKNKLIDYYTEKIICPNCNIKISRGSISKHNKTIEHIINDKFKELNKDTTKKLKKLYNFVKKNEEVKPYLNKIIF